MSKLSELMKSPDVGRPRKTYSICVAGKLAEALETATAELGDAQIAYENELANARAAADEPTGPPKRTGEKSKIPALEKAAKAKAEEADAIRDRMLEHTVDLLLDSWPNGDWRRWVSKHPARDEESDPAGFRRDRVHAGSFCNIDALIVDAGEFVVKYGDEDPTDESWAFILANAASADLTKLASTIVGMHEQPVDTGKGRVDWFVKRRSAAVSE